MAGPFHCALSTFKHWERIVSRWRPALLIPGNGPPGCTRDHVVTSEHVDFSAHRLKGRRRCGFRPRVMKSHLRSKDQLTPRSEPDVNLVSCFGGPPESGCSQRFV